MDGETETLPLGGRVCPLCPHHGRPTFLTFRPQILGDVCLLIEEYSRSPLWAGRKARLNGRVDIEQPFVPHRAAIE